MSRIPRRIAIAATILVTLLVVNLPVPAHAQQPGMTFPWNAGTSWYFTGGPHDWTAGSRSGLDFAPNGTTAVRAAADGVVYFAGWAHLGGCSDDNVINVRISHADGWETWYLHLSATAWGNPGAVSIPVHAGDYIGEVGSTGCADATHVHIELVHNAAHVSWNGMEINGWTIHTDCSGWTGQGYTGPGTCSASNYNGYMSNDANGNQVIPWAPATAAQLVQASSPSACSGAPAPGAGSSRQPMFQAAYDRAGGMSALGCALNTAYWWCANGCAVRQDFPASRAGGASIIHDESSDNPPDSLPAWVVYGGMRDCYLNTYASLGPPMSDAFTNSTGQGQQNYRYGYIWWDGSCHAVNWPNGWYFANGGSDTNARLAIAAPPAGTYGSTAPIAGAQLVVDDNGGTGSWSAQNPFIVTDQQVSVTSSTGLYWTQIDDEHSLLVAIVVKGVDNVERRLIYAANASNHWGDPEYVDMTGDPSGFGAWMHFDRNIWADYMTKYGVAPSVTTHVEIGHYELDSWMGDHGGTVGGICIADYLGDCDGDGLLNTLETAYGTDPMSPDTDGDGCGDETELGGSAQKGGQRDPLKAYDFYDVPAPALRLGFTGQARDHAIGVTSDVLALLVYTGENSTSPDYVADRDGNGIADGLQYDRSVSASPAEPWLSGAPDGAIGITSDVLAMLAQVGDSCA